MSVPLVTGQLVQTAVAWLNPRTDGRGGVTTDKPVEVDALWIDRQERFLDVDGEEKVSRALVFVDRDMVPGEFLKLCGLADLAGDTTPRGEDAYEVRATKKVPLFDGSDYVRKVWLR